MRSTDPCSPSPKLKGIATELDAALGCGGKLHTAPRHDDATCSWVILQHLKPEPHEHYPNNSKLNKKLTFFDVVGTLDEGKAVSSTLLTSHLYQRNMAIWAVHE